MKTNEKEASLELHSEREREREEICQNNVVKKKTIPLLKN